MAAADGAFRIVFVIFRWSLEAFRYCYCCDFFFIFFAALAFGFGTDWVTDWLQSCLRSSVFGYVWHVLLPVCLSVFVSLPLCSEQVQQLPRLACCYCWISPIWFWVSSCFFVAIFFPYFLFLFLHMQNRCLSSILNLTHYCYVLVLNFCCDFLS